MYCFQLVCVCVFICVFLCVIGTKCGTYDISYCGNYNKWGLKKFGRSRSDLMWCINMIRVLLEESLTTRLNSSQSASFLILMEGNSQYFRLYSNYVIHIVLKSACPPDSSSFNQCDHCVPLLSEPCSDWLKELDMGVVYFDFCTQVIWLLTLPEHGTASVKIILLLSK